MSNPNRFNIILSFSVDMDATPGACSTKESWEEIIKTAMLGIVPASYNPEIENLDAYVFDKNSAVEVAVGEDMLSLVRSTIAARRESIEPGPEESKALTSQWGARQTGRDPARRVSDDEIICDEIERELGIKPTLKMGDEKRIISIDPMQLTEADLQKEDWEPLEDVVLPGGKIVVEKLHGEIAGQIRPDGTRYGTDNYAEDEAQENAFAESAEKELVDSISGPSRHDSSQVYNADEEDGTKTDLPWAMSTATSMSRFLSEEDACEAQREWRRINGLDPMTGRVVVDSDWEPLEDVVLPGGRLIHEDEEGIIAEINPIPADVCAEQSDDHYDEVAGRRAQREAHGGGAFAGLGENDSNSQEDAFVGDETMKLLERIDDGKPPFIGVKRGELGLIAAGQTTGRSGLGEVAYLEARNSFRDELPREMKYAFDHLMRATDFQKEIPLRKNEPIALEAVVRDRDNEVLAFRKELTIHKNVSKEPENLLKDHFLKEEGDFFVIATDVMVKEIKQGEMYSVCTLVSQMRMGFVVEETETSYFFRDRMKAVERFNDMHAQLVTTGHTLQD